MEFAILESAVPPNTVSIFPILKARGFKCGAEMCILNHCSCLSLEMKENISLSFSFVTFAVLVVVKIFCNVKISVGHESFVALGFACCCCCGASLYIYIIVQLLVLVVDIYYCCDSCW